MLYYITLINIFTNLLSVLQNKLKRQWKELGKNLSLEQMRSVVNNLQSEQSEDEIDTALAQLHMDEPTLKRVKKSM